MATVLSRRILSPTVLLYSFVVISGIADAFYLGRQIEPPPLFSLVRWVGLLWVMGWWLRADSRKRAVASVYDMGFFLYIAWPVVMPYYLLKTRGAKGLPLYLGFCWRICWRSDSWFCFVRAAGVTLCWQRCPTNRWTRAAGACCA